MSALPFAAPSTRKIPFGHKIHHQIQFLKKNFSHVCSNIITMAASEATVSRVNIGIFKALPWIKSYNQRK
jgi:hypothetical protein